MLGDGGCKGSGAASTDETPANQDCLAWAYSDRTLTLNHINACFNCCPEEIEADFTVGDNAIRIQEAEAGCRCLCLYDLQHSVRNLEPGEYAVTVAEPYVGAEEKQLVASLTLNDGASGAICVERDKYPWGVP